MNTHEPLSAAIEAVSEAVETPALPGPRQQDVGNKNGGAILWLLVGILAMQIVQSWQLAALPQAPRQMTASEKIQAEGAASRAALAALEESQRFEESQRRAQVQAAEEREFQEALARIPVDVPEPKRSQAARELVKIEREQPRPGESDMDFRVRNLRRKAGNYP